MLMLHLTTRILASHLIIYGKETGDILAAGRFDLLNDRPAAREPHGQRLTHQFQYTPGADPLSHKGHM